MTAPARRPWWKRKRWAAAGLLWLVVSYVCGFAAVGFADGRGWVPRSSYPVFTAAYAPFFGPNGVRPWIEPYATWLYDLGQRHAASD